jgi:hypothetical protein
MRSASSTTRETSPKPARMDELGRVPWKHDVRLVSSGRCRTGVSLERRDLIHRVDRVPAEGLSYGKTPVEVRVEHLPMLAHVQQFRIGVAGLDWARQRFPCQEVLTQCAGGTSDVKRS